MRVFSLREIVVAIQIGLVALVVATSTDTGLRTVAGETVLPSLTSMPPAETVVAARTPVQERPIPTTTAPAPIEEQSQPAQAAKPAGGAPTPAKEPAAPSPEPQPAGAPVQQEAPPASPQLPPTALALEPAPAPDADDDSKGHGHAAPLPPGLAGELPPGHVGATETFTPPGHEHAPGLEHAGGPKSKS